MLNAMKQARDALQHIASMPPGQPVMDGRRKVSDEHAVAYRYQHVARAALASLDAAIGQQEAQEPVATLTQRLQQRCCDWDAYWRASDAHGVVLTQEQALELLRDALGVEVEIKQEPGAVSAWWALVMGAAASIEDAANCLRDADAKKQADGAAKHYREAAQKLYASPVAAAPHPLSLEAEVLRDAAPQGEQQAQRRDKTLGEVRNLAAHASMYLQDRQYGFVDKALAGIVEAVDAARSAQDAPASGGKAAPAPQAWRGLTKSEIDHAVGELIEYGTEFVAPLYSVVEGIERKLRERNAGVEGRLGD